MRKINIDLLDEYSRAVVEDMELEDLRNEVQEVIYARLMQEPWVDVVNEISSGEFADLLDKYEVKCDG